MKATKIISECELFRLFSLCGEAFSSDEISALHPARAFFAEQAKKSSFPTGGHSEHTAPGDEEKISTNGIEQDTIRLSGSGSVCPGYGRGASVPAALAGDAGARQ
jgi:hypothetical protein